MNPTPSSSRGSSGETARRSTGSRGDTRSARSPWRTGCCRIASDAEDVVQDAFIAAVNAIDSFDPGRPFGPWFMRIVVNKGLTAIRSRAAEAKHVRGAELSESDAVAVVERSLLERAEIRDRFRAALRLLPQRQQLIVQLADVEGFTSAEIAGQLAIPSGTVRWLLHQARERRCGSRSRRCGRTDP